MNALYHIAILEGYPSQHSDLPRNVPDAIGFFKQQASPQPVAAAAKKKRNLSPEQKERMLAQLARMRAARGLIPLSEEIKSRILKLKEKEIRELRAPHLSEKL